MFPTKIDPVWVEDSTPWWERTVLDADRNGIHDSIQRSTGTTGIGLSYGVDVNEAHLSALYELNLSEVEVIESVDAVLLGSDRCGIWHQRLPCLTDVVMVEHYGAVVFYGDVQTPAVKASNSLCVSKGCLGSWVSAAQASTSQWSTPVWITNTPVSMKNSSLAMMQCVTIQPIPLCIAKAVASVRPMEPSILMTGNQHGTACMGMAAATGIDAQR